MPTTQELRTPIRLSADAIRFEAEKEENGPRRFRMTAYTGAPVDRLFGQMALDLSGFSLPDRLPMLLNHDADAVVGFADTLEATESELLLSGVIIETEEAGRRVTELGDAGFPLTASVGVMVERLEQLPAGEEREVNGRKVSGPMSIATKLRLFETSFITAGPADDQTSAQVLNTEETRMDSVAFAKENPDAIKAWRDEGAESIRVELAQVLDALPEDRRGWGALEFSKGKTLTEIKAALSEVLLSELDAQKEATAKAEKRAAKATTTSQTLAAKAGNPGVGFNGQAHETGDGQADLSGLPFEERCAAEWGRDPNLQAEFGGRFGAYIAWASRQPQEV